MRSSAWRTSSSPGSDPVAARNKVVQLDPRRVQPAMLGRYVHAFLRDTFGQPDHKIIPEHRFAPYRKWRFDLAVLPERVAVEFQGGTHTAGRHTRGPGYRADAEKYLEAAVHGWVVLSIPYDLLRDRLDETLNTIALVIARRK